ncbi:hypothetical protein Tco_0624529 [Tanacetum coccineum]|uniref:Uncharacterized protein n=1 Tax=Tanacetum coccineum TaxID=301880 RepID=A0ABQ4WE56_9ASTR
MLLPFLLLISITTLRYLRGAVIVIKRKYSSTSLRRYGLADLRAYQMDRRLSAQLNVESNDSSMAFADLNGNQLVTTSSLKRRIIAVTKGTSSLWIKTLKICCFFSAMKSDNLKLKNLSEETQPHKSLTVTASNLRRQRRLTPYFPIKSDSLREQRQEERLMRIDDLHKSAMVL